MPGSTN